METGNEKQRIGEKFRELLSSFDHKTGEAISHGLVWFASFKSLYLRLRFNSGSMMRGLML